MATAKTPKTVPAAKPAAAKPTVAAKPIAPTKPVAAKPVAAKPPAAKPVAAIAAAAKPVEEAVIHSTEIVAEPAAEPKKAVAVVVKAAEDAGETVMKGVTPLIDFSRENAILFVATGNELALGFHKLSLSLIDWSAESCDKSVAAGQAMLAAKTVEEVLDLSQSLARDGLQQLLKEGTELSALSSKLIEDAIVPLPGRLAAAVEKLAFHAA